MTLATEPAADAPPEATSASIRARLGGMMFLQYFMQGAYLPIASVYVQDHLKFDSRQTGVFNASLAVGPLLAPFIVGQLADRHVATERLLAACHLLAGCMMLCLFSQTGFWPVIVLGTVYSVLYVPTMMLTNSLALVHLRSPDREFPRVRLWGTIGFILPAWLIEFWWLAGLQGDELNSARGVAFAISGIAGLVMAAYCLTLPHTPPQERSAARFAPAEAIGMLRERSVLVLVVVSFMIAMVHNFYFVWNSPFLSTLLKRGGIQGAWEQRISSLGQVSEIVVMAVLGRALARWGFKRVMMLGATAYLARCLILALAGTELPFAASISLAAVGQTLHGLCFGCFLAVAFIFVDRVAPTDARRSMQTLYGTFVLGLGFFAGAWAAGLVGQVFEFHEGSSLAHAWTPLWLTCAALAAIALAAFGILFPDLRNSDRPSAAGGSNPE